MQTVRWCVWLALALITPITAAADQVKLRVTLQLPASNPFMGLSVVQFKEEVEKEANNEVLIEIFDRGKLYNDDQVVDAVRSGAIEMGVAGFHQVSRMLPALDIMELPFLFNFEALVRAATSPDSELRQLIDPAILESTGMRVLWWQTIGPQIFFSKGEDVLDPARIKNKRIRVNSDTMATFTKHCGGTPVVLSVTQVHDALKNGTLDMAMISVTAAETRELWKVTDTITRTDHGLIEFLVTINEKSWQALSDSQRAIMVTAARRAERDVRARASQIEAKAYDFARGKGMKVYELTPDHVAEWRACGSEIIDNYMSNGGELTRHLMDAYGRLRTEPCCTAGPGGAFHRR